MVDVSESVVVVGGGGGGGDVNGGRRRGVGVWVVAVVVAAGFACL